MRERGTEGDTETKSMVDAVMDFVIANRSRHFCEPDDDTPKSQSMAGVKVKRELASEGGAPLKDEFGLPMIGADEKPDKVWDYWFTKAGLEQAGGNKATIVAKALDVAGLLLDKDEPGLQKKYTQGGGHRGHRFYVVTHAALLKWQGGAE
jgi:hypothetical protein